MCWYVVYADVYQSRPQKKKNEHTAEMNHISLHGALLIYCPYTQVLCLDCATDSPSKNLTKSVAMRIFKMMSAQNEQVSVSSFALKLKHMGLDDADADAIIKSMDPKGTGRITCVHNWSMLTRVIGR